MLSAVPKDGKGTKFCRRFFEPICLRTRLTAWCQMFSSSIRAVRHPAAATVLSGATVKSDLVPGRIGRLWMRVVSFLTDGCLRLLTQLVNPEWLQVGPRLFVTGALLLTGGCAVGVFGFPACVLLLFVFLGICVGCLLSRLKQAVILAMLPVLMWQYTCWRMPSCLDNDVSHFAGGKQKVLQGEVVQILSPGEGNVTRAVVSVQRMLFPPQGQVGGKILLTLFGQSPGKSSGKRSLPLPFVLAEGDLVRVRGRIALPEGAAYPFEVDQKVRLARRGIFSVMSATGRSVCQLGKATGDDSKPFAESGVDALSGKVEGCFSCLRMKMLDLHRKAIGCLDGDLLASMVIGDRAVNLPETLSSKFRLVGLSHILAASGFNLTMVTAIVWWLVRLVTRSALAVNIAAFLGMSFFVGLAGLSPSVERAAIMCGLVLLSRCFFRTLHPPAALAAALVLTLIVDPLCLADVGMQLSYCATAGIIIGVTPLSRCLVKLFPSLNDKLVEALSVVLVAQSSVLPLQVLYFWQVGLFFVLSNMLVAPVVPLATIFGFASSLLAIAGTIVPWSLPVAMVLDRVADLPLKLMIWTVDCLSSCAWARINVGPPCAFSIVCYYCCLLALFRGLSCRHLVKESLACFLLALVCMLCPARLPDLTLVCSNASVLLLDSRHQALCLGDEKSCHVARPLLYFGCRLVACDSVPEVKGVDEGDFVSEPFGSAWLVAHKLTGFRLLVLSDDWAKMPCTASGIPSCDAVCFVSENRLDTVSASASALVPNNETSGSSKRFCDSESSGDSEPFHILLRKSGARTVILNHGVISHKPDLEHELAKLAGLSVLHPDGRHCLIFRPGGCGALRP